MDIDGRIGQANGRLKTANIRVQIRKVGGKLYLRATFPPQPGEIASKQRSLALGISANPIGLKLAEAKAKEISVLLDSKTFDWTPYLKQQQSTQVLQTDRTTIGEWVEKFTQNYFESRPQTPTKLNTFKKEFTAIFRHLPAEELLSTDLLKAAILKRSRPETRNRKRWVVACQKLAEIAGIECNFKPLIGAYSPKHVSPRDLPSDEEIEAWYYQIADPAWRWSFGVIATFGIRPHELWHLDTSRLASSPGVLRVLASTKTGERLCYPCSSAWLSEFQLWDVKKPPLPKAENNNDLGAVVSKTFKQDLGIPFPPYHLRHAYAGRTAALGVDVAIAAKWMGHSVDVHCRIYHLFLQERHHQTAFELMTQAEKLLG
ncbi:MAG: site-specific integrase [Cyanosarcina radialis HA8281-LM2]|jgi:integrase|nr:site-specific integrase [Cyanosarcina radialis HA8281-LM2]